jgi:hypothetical protein
MENGSIFWLREYDVSSVGSLAKPKTVDMNNVK